MLGYKGEWVGGCVGGWNGWVGLMGGCVDRWLGGWVGGLVDRRRNRTGVIGTKGWDGEWVVGCVGGIGGCVGGWVMG